MLKAEEPGQSQKFWFITSITCSKSRPAILQYVKICISLIKSCWVRSTDQDNFIIFIPICTAPGNPKLLRFDKKLTSLCLTCKICNVTNLGSKRRLGGWYLVKTHSLLALSFTKTSRNIPMSSSPYLHTISKDHCPVVDSVAVN